MSALPQRHPLDTVLASRVHAAVAELNRVAGDALKAGLEIRYTVVPVARMGQEHEEVVLSARVSRNL